MRKHITCRCQNIDVHGREVDLRHKTALSYSSYRGILQRQKDYPLMQIAAAAITIRSLADLSVTRAGPSKYVLTCRGCSEAVDVHLCRNNFYAQFGASADDSAAPDTAVPADLRVLFNMRQEPTSPLFHVHNTNSMDVSAEFSLEPELSEDLESGDGDDYDIMFGNQCERFVGSLQDRVIYSPFYMDAGVSDY